MEKITLTSYLEKKSESKKIIKRITRAIKTYRHAVKDISHAAADIAHAKEDCLYAVQAYEQLLDDCHSYLQDWKTCEMDDELETVEIVHVGGEEELHDDQDFSAGIDLEEDEMEEEDEDEEEQTVCEQAEEHLEHASKDFARAIGEADSALNDLGKIDGLLFDIIEIAEVEGFIIDLADARAYVVAKAGEAQAAPATEAPVAA